MGILAIFIRAFFGGGSSWRSRYQGIPVAKRKLPQPCSPARSQQTLLNSVAELKQAKVLWVLDGDSVIVECEGENLEVRLDSIDCPEDGQPWGDTAKYGLIKMIGGKPIRLEIHGVDGHGRTLATGLVWIESKNRWENVNERMVMLGHAWVMRQYYGHLPNDRKNNLNRLENWAKSKNVGLWGTDDPMPPWQWRSQTGTGE